MNNNTWKDLMEFINNNPVGVAAKIFAATALAYVVDNMQGLVCLPY